jgi:uncharacterized protein with GYD domain
MALYIMALTINPTAKKQHPDLSSQISKSFDIFPSNKVRVKNLYATLGRYDYIAIFETDDQSLAFKVASQINQVGILETETWPVIPYEDFSHLIG